MNARSAINQSSRLREIVRLDYQPELATELRRYADDHVRANGVWDFWGTDDDGDEWRIQLVLPQDIDAPKFRVQIRTEPHRDWLLPYGWGPYDTREEAEAACVRARELWLDARVILCWPTPSPLQPRRVW